MKISFPKEHDQNEQRISLTPSLAKRYLDLGFSVLIEKNYGQTINIPDDEFRSAGAMILDDRPQLLASGDLVLKLKKPTLADIALFKKNAVSLSFLDPFNDHDLIKKLAQRSVSAISMEMIPRITRAQKMDALSSQASLAGYAAVLLAAKMLPKIFPMQMTAAGTIPPAKVLILGAGVAGLQAIATAKRLGARVEAFDTRPEVAEQIQSLGAKALKIDLGINSTTNTGYAKELTAEQIERQRAAMTKFCANADIIITTAQVFGKKAPRLITVPMIQAIKPGSVIIDMAVETGGNVEGSRPDEKIIINGVTVIGAAHLPSQVAVDASVMYATNIFNFVAEYWNKQTRTFSLDTNDAILKECLITHQGLIINEKIRALLGQG